MTSAAVSFSPAPGGLRFYRQEKNGRFTDVTDETGLDPATLTADYFGVWAVDYDLDGDLDLIAAPRSGPVLVLRNTGDGTFKVVKPFAGVTDIRAFVWIDLDNDGAPDAAFLDSAGKLHVFMNEWAGQFHERSLPGGIGNLLALAVGDVTVDGLFNLLTLRDDGVIQRLSAKDKDKSWETATLTRWSDFPTGQKAGTYRLLVADLDNNGGLDLLAAGPADSQFWLSDQDGKFAAQGKQVQERVFAAVDLTKDGRLDLLALTKAGQPVRRVNRGTKNYHWQEFRLSAEDRRHLPLNFYELMNSFAIGAEIEVHSGLLTQKQLIASPVIHFGLGDQSRIAVARFLWTNGDVETAYDLTIDQTLSKQQRILVW